MPNTANLPFYLAKFELITYMRVLIVSGGKPTKKYPFIGNFAFEQAVALADSGTDVTFFGIDLRSFRRKRPYGISYGVAGKVRWYVIIYILRFIKIGKNRILSMLISLRLDKWLLL